MRTLQNATAVAAALISLFAPFTMSVADAAHPHITITSISPSSGPSAGGTQVTITGTGFTNLDSVRLGWAKLQNVTVSADGTTITGTTRAVNSMGGVVDVRVGCHCHGVSGDAVLPKGFTYLPHPHILVQSITPNTGPVTGGTQVVIVGYGFQNLASATIGGIPIQNITVDALGQKITGTTGPAAAAGAVDVVVQCRCHGPGQNRSVLPDGFTYTASNPATQIAYASGDLQKGVAGTALANPLVVVVKDANNNPVAGFQVTFAVAVGGGKLSATQVATDANGNASTALTLGATAGANQVTATAAGLTGSPVTFNETGIVGAAAVIAISSGNNQAATAGTALTNPLVVVVTDANKNPVANFQVAFAVATGGGALTATAVATDANGLAQTSLTVGKAAGANTVTATATGLSGSPILFTEKGTAGPAVQIALLSGDKQQGAVSTPLAAPLVVVVTDANNNPVAGFNVTFAVIAGAGKLSGTAVATGVNGQAQTSLTLGPAATENDVTATATGLTGSPITFTELGVASPATQIALVSGDKQVGVAGSALTNPCVVVVKDANNNPVQGFNVVFAAATGGGKLSATAVATDANGQAATTLTLGTAAGPNTVTATAAGLTGSPITFNATGQAGPATVLAILSGNNQQGAVNTKLANPLVVVVTDANKNPVANVAVTFAVTTGGGTLSVAAAVPTGANGQAQASLTLGPTVTANTVTVTATGLTAVVFTEAALAAPATQIALVSGDAQVGVAGTALAKPCVVIVKDANNNPVQGFNVVFAVATGGGKLSATAVATDATGQASTTLTLGTTAGKNSVTATATGLTGSPVTFNATGNAGPATQIAIASGNKQQGAVSAPLANPLVVLVTDVNNNPVANFNVTFAVTAGAGTLSATAVATGANGQAQTSLTLGPVATENDVTATATGLTGSPLLFTFLGVASPATQVAIVSGNVQNGVAGSALANPFVVVVKDANNLPVTGFGVTFAVATGAGTLSATTVATDATGQAKTTLTLGKTAGPNSVTATATGLTGSPITFTATGTAGAATQIALSSGNNQAGVAGSALANALVVVVKDVNNNPVQAFNVAFAVATGGGTVTAASATDVNGLASTKLTLGKTAGPNTVTATATGLVGSPITFTETGNAGPAATIAIVSGNNQNGTTGTALANALVVVVSDVNNNRVAGNNVTFAVTAGGGTLSATAVPTGANGQAQTALTLGAAAGANTVTATATGVGTPATFTETGAAKQLTYTTDIAPLLMKQICTVCHAPGGPEAVTPLTTYMQVRFGVATESNPAGAPLVVPGNAAASWIIQKLTPPGGTMYVNLGPDDPTRLANLQIITTWINQGAFNSTPGAATQIAMTSGNNQSGPAGTALPQPLVVEVMDASLNPVPGYNSVTFAATAGGGTLSNVAAVTTALGNAAATLTPGTGPNTVTATATGLTGSPISFTETGNAVANYSGAPLTGSANPLDQAALVALKAQGIEPAPLSGDPEFLMRATTVLCGRLPTPAELSAFLADTTATKRATAIDGLLASADFPKHWATDIIGPWCGVAPTESATFTFDATLQSELSTDTPLSTFVGELAQGMNNTGVAWDYHWNSLYASNLDSNPPAPLKRQEAPTYATDRLMWAFTGMSSRCARCHNHHLTTTADDPQWLQADNYALYAYQVDNSTYCTIYQCATNSRVAAPTQPGFVADGYASAPAGQPTLGTNSRNVDLNSSLAARRAAFASVFTKSNAFHRGTAHRIWAEIATQLIDPDQFLAANLAGDPTPALLTALATAFANSNSQLKAFLRVCLNSNLWQLTAAYPSQAGDTYQGRYVIRRQHAEVIDRSVNEVLGTAYTNPTKLFTSLFGYPVRKGGNFNEIHDRSDAINLAQTLVQMNSSSSTSGLEANSSFLNGLANSVDVTKTLTYDQAATQVVQAILQRPPTAAELSTIDTARAASPTTIAALQDLAVGVMTSAEFMMR
jgi:adhesin/invasin